MIPEREDATAQFDRAPEARGGRHSTPYLLALTAGVLMVIGLNSSGHTHPPSAAPFVTLKHPASGGIDSALRLAEVGGTGTGDIGVAFGAATGHRHDQLVANYHPARLLKPIKHLHQRPSGEAFYGVISEHAQRAPADLLSGVNAALMSRELTTSAQKQVPTVAQPTFMARAVQPNSPKSILITGAAGFIGSHFALLLLDRGGYRITAVDDLSRSSYDTVLRLKDLAKAAKGADFLFVQEVRAWALRRLGCGYALSLYSLD